MAGPNTTPWEPGCLVLNLDDLRERNPYSRKVLSAAVVMQAIAAIAIVAYQTDSNIALIQRQSKL